MLRPRLQRGQTPLLIQHAGTRGREQNAKVLRSLYASPCVKVCEGVYTATEYTRHYTLSLNNEFSYTYRVMTA